MFNIAKQIKDQTDSILRRRQAAPGSSMTVQGGTTQPGTGPGTPPEIVDPNSGLAAHKVSGDHDGRYYTEAEIDAKFAALVSAAVLRKPFSGADTIVVEHSLGKWPVVQVVGQTAGSYGAGLYGAGAYGGFDAGANVLLTPSSVAHDSVNQITVTLATVSVGEVICIG